MRVEETRVTDLITCFPVENKNFLLNEAAKVYIKFLGLERMPLKDTKGFEHMIFTQRVTKSETYKSPVDNLIKWGSKSDNLKSITGTYQIVIGGNSKVEKLKAPLYYNINNSKMFKSLSLLIALVFSCYSSFSQAPAAYKESVLTTKRSEIVINGIWDFKPSLNIDNDELNIDWGQIWVPGAWTTNDVWWQRVPGIVKKGVDSSWHDLLNIQKAWYRTKVKIPQSWSKSLVEIDLAKVSTDAVIYINDKKVGIINWYAGKLDITSFIKFGTENEIKILVIANPNQGEVANLMGTATDQVTFSRATLATKGLTGNVLLTSHPKELFIMDVFVKTSVRNQMIEAEIELSKLVKSSDLVFINEILDEKNVIVKKFEQRVNAVAAQKQVLNVKSIWTNPELWDLDQPNLYRFRTTLKFGGKVMDVYEQEFGFREFWIEGKNFFLNGTRINLRPTLDAGGHGMTEIIEASIEGLRNSGYNFSELWPNNNDIRGDIKDWHEVMDVADRKGFLLSGVAMSFTSYIRDNKWSYKWNIPGVKETWEQRMALEMKRQRNHPSIVMWGTSANFFGHAQDQDPIHIGQKDWIIDNDFWQKNAEAGIEAIGKIKNFDSTRPVFTHHGAYVGDVHTLNFYLNLLPLQEREEWMSHYSKYGKIPFIGIEFGTPLYCTFLRGRNGYGNNVQTEPLATEFSAMYVGPKAYQTETEEYRSLIKNNFLVGQKYRFYTNPKEIERLPAFQEVQNLFSKNTWRSWRTWEVSGGMIPWNKGHGWGPAMNSDRNISMPPFKAGRKGNYFTEAKATDLNFLRQPEWDILPGGKAIIENNSEVLAYIGGEEKAFTSKDHSFKNGDSIKKQFFFFNDTRIPQTFSWTAKLIISGKEYKSESGSSSIAIGEKKNVPFSYQLPNQQTQFKQNGKIILSTNINNKILTDTLHFRVFNEKVEDLNQVNVFDPEGKTTEMLQKLGFKVKSWDKKSKISFLIIGRNAMLKKNAMDFDLQKFVNDGGKALVMNQHPDSVTAKEGFRVSPYISRYVFPVDSTHTLFKELDELDFRNWSGESKLTQAYPSYATENVKKGSHEIPYYGWHWGNRGGVATGAVEKPHRSAWKPLLECEFDMAWTPLMELPYGNGQLVWCGLDLEDHYEQDIVATIIGKRLVNYVDTLKPLKRSTKTVLIGNNNDKLLLDDIGISYQYANDIPFKTELLIVGNIDINQEKRVIKYINQGGKALVLPRNNTTKFLDVAYEVNEKFKGSYQLTTWPVAAGISVSDTRYRSEVKTVLIKSGCEITLDGLLGQKNVGLGKVVFTQFDPNRFNADSLTYLRFTRWRYTRALSQVAANMGASFIMDKAFFQQERPQKSVSLDGMWKATMTSPLPAVNDIKDKYLDPGISDLAKSYVSTNADETNMVEIESGVDFEKANKDWNAFDGEIVYRKTIEIPEVMVSEDLSIVLGVLDDYDQVFFNGVLIGQTGSEIESVWSYNRTYTIPANLVKAGKNVIAIRIFDTFGGGGIMPSDKPREIVFKDKRYEQGFYHPDYIDDFEMGDDPFRYYRW